MITHADINYDAIKFNLAVFCPHYLTLPIAVPKRVRWNQRERIIYRAVYIFGFRVAYWTLLVS